MRRRRSPAGPDDPGRADPSARADDVDDLDLADVAEAIAVDDDPDDEGPDDRPEEDGPDEDGPERPPGDEGPEGRRVEPVRPVRPDGADRGPRDAAEERGDMDPRFRARLDEQQAARRLRRRRVLVAVGAGVLVVLLAVLIAKSSLLGVDTVEVRGARRTSTAAIIAASGIETGDALLDVDEGAAERRIGRLPFVDSVDVASEFPDTVVITVTERSPVAWVKGRRTIAVLDGSGRVLERVTEPPGLLPEVVGITAPDDPGRTIEDAAVLRGIGRFPAELLLRAAQVRYVPGRTSITIRGERPEAAEIRIGSFKRADAKTRAAVAVLEELRRRGEQVRYVDVRVPEAPATR